MARHYFADPAPADRRGHLGPYAQASLWVGRIDTDWHTTDPSWMQDTDISYDSNVPYYGAHLRSEEHTSELQSLMRISYAVFCLKKNKTLQNLIAYQITLLPINNNQPSK